MVDIRFDLEVILNKDTLPFKHFKERITLQDGPYDVLKETLCQGLQIACDNLKKEVRNSPP